MKIISSLRFPLAVAFAVVFAAAAAPDVLAQYDERYQISVVQQQVRTQIINDLLDSGHDFQFNNDALVRASGVSRQNRVTGSGRHRFNRSGWRTFTYEGEFSLRNGRVISVDYSFLGGGSESQAGMTWTGRVDDIVRVRVSGRRAFTQTVSGRPATGVRFSFLDSLPRRPLTVTVRRTGGRGDITVIEQPTVRNNFSAVVEVRDNRGGADNYSFELFWGAPGPVVPPIGNRPGDGSMNWQGNVDDTVQITIRGRQAFARAIRGRAPTSVIANFQSAIPRRPVNVTIRTIEGRGDVRVIQQPSRQNGFSAVIEIRDSRGGSDRYAFEATWDTFGSGGDESAGMTWTGRVDGTARVTVQGRNASVREVQTGVRVDNVSFDFFDALPRRAVNVRLRVIDGRGTVRLISEPRSANGYSAVVEINDPQSGSDFYTFELEWDDRGGEEPPDREAQMSWRGVVDDVVQIRVSGRFATARAISGQRVSGVRFDFAEALPRRAVKVTVNKREGRGDVTVIQQPTRFNNFTAVIEIVDRSGGRDTYEFDLNW